MSAIEFKLETFEGPLDLLLFLVNRHKLDIYDIEISLLLDQYLEYMDSMEEEDFDQAGEFLAMAARLIYIKTCSLLPKAEEAEELKKELEGELIEYSMCKEAAARLRELCVFGDVFVRPPEKLPVNKVFTGTIDPKKLLDAYLGMSAKARRMKPVRAEQFDPIVTSRIVTVTSKIVHVLKMLYTLGHCTMAELYEGVEDKSARVATFLAVLELTKSGRVMLNDDNTEISFNRDSPRRKRPENERPKIFIAEEEAHDDGRTEEDTAYDETDGIIEDESAYAEDDTASEEAFHGEIVTRRESLPVTAVIPASDRERYIGAVRSVRELVIAMPSPSAVSAAAEVQYPAEPSGTDTETDIKADTPKPTEDKETDETPCGSVLYLTDGTDPYIIGQITEDTADIIKEETQTTANDCCVVPIRQHSHCRLNRFSRRYYWGFPACGNCLPYRRERL